MKRLLREPLLHFVLLGAALFLAYRWVRVDEGSREPREIVVTTGQIEQLAAGFARTWQRPPTIDEMAGLVRDRVREEVYCREAVALGLDREDTVIRRRLRQKMEFVTDDLAALAEPTDVQLEAYLHAHPEAFQLEPRCTFLQVYLDPQKHGAELARDAEKIRTELDRVGAEADLSTLGDSRLLDQRYAGLSSSEVADRFGDRFAVALGNLPRGRWQGPLESGFGAHLVFVEERVEPRLPPLVEARAAVRREWENAQRVAANEAFYANLLERYTVIIEGVGPAGRPEIVAADEAR